ncbi:MAG TPA: Ig-like domain-containing protein, partial [Myxococcota bacterium]|nr:Ig-like domain-containing protein [Myxococcota bacterium]
MQGIPGPVVATALAAGLSLSGYCSCPDNHVVPINRRPDLNAPTVSAVSVGPCDTGIPPSDVSPTQPIAIVFSERMDPATLSAETVLVVAGEVDETFLSDVNNPPLSESRRALVAPATLALSPDGSTLTYTLTAPLAGLSLYTLVVSEDVRDVNGAPLVDALGQAGAFTCQFYTADAGSGPPLASLLNPPPGATVGVPPNIRAVVVGFSEPVMQVGPSSFRVTDATDAPVAGLVGASDPACSGAEPLTCFAYVFSATLAVSTEFTILLTSDITDNDGNPLAETSFTFTTADTVDTSPPVITNVAVTPGEDTATVRWDTDEPSTSLVHWAQGAGLPAASLTMASTGAPGVAAGAG